MECDCCDPTHDSPDPVLVRLESENEELRAQLAEARAALAKYLDGQFVVHTGDDLEYYDTEKEAIEAAQRAIYELSADSESGWPAIVNNVKVMRVVHAVKQFDHVDDYGVPFTLYSIAEE